MPSDPRDNPFNFQIKNLVIGQTEDGKYQMRLFDKDNRVIF